MEPLRIPLEVAPSVTHVARLHGTAVEGIEAGRDIEFDLSETRDIDASIMQLLLATRLTAGERAVTATLTGLSESMAARLVQFGGEDLIAGTDVDEVGQTPIEPTPQPSSLHAAPSPATAPMSDGSLP